VHPFCKLFERLSFAKSTQRLPNTFAGKPTYGMPIMLTSGDNKAMLNAV
jgi:hypothetical protein